MIKNNDIHHSKIYLLLNFLTLLGYLVLYPIITKSIEPSVYGQYIVLHASVSILVGFSNLGCKIGYKRNFFESNQKVFLNNLLFSTQILIASIFGMILIIFFIFEDNIYKYFNISNQIRSIFLLLLISVMIDSFSKYYLIYLENNKLSKKYFLLFFFKTYLYFLITILLIFFNYGLKSIVYGLLASNIYLLIVTLYNQFCIGLNKYRFNLNLVKNVLSISLPATPRSLLGKINSDLDKILIGYFLNTESTGIYAIGQSISYSLFQIITSLDKVFVPEMYKMMFINQFNKIGKYIGRFFFFCALITVGLISSVNLIVDNLLDKSYAGSKIIVIIFSIYYLTLFFSKIVSHQFIFLKKVIVSTYIFFLNICMNIMFTIPAVLYIGIYGAAVSTIVSSVFSLLISIKIIKKSMDIKYDIKNIFIIYCFVASATAIQAYVITSNISENYYVQICITLLISSIFIIYGFAIKLVNKKSIQEILKL